MAKRNHIIDEALRQKEIYGDYHPDRDLSNIKSAEFDGSHENTNDGKQGVYDKKFQDMLAGSNLGDTFAGNKKAASAGDLNDAENDAANQDEPDGSGPRKRRIWTRARARATGAIAGTGILGTLLIGNLSLGPLQVVHLSEAILHGLSRQQSDTKDSQHKWLRDLNSLRKGDFRYSRVGLIGGAMANSLSNELEAAGIKFTGSDSLGRPTGVELDQGKLAKTNPEVGDMTSEEFDSWAKENFNVDGDVKGGKFDIGGFKDQDIAKTIKTARGFAGNDGVISGLKARSLKKFWGLGSIFHPFSRALDNKIREQEAAAAKAKEEGKTNETTPEEGVSDPADPESSVMEEQTNAEIQATEPEVNTSVSDIEGAANDTGRKVANWTGLGQGQLLQIGCTLKSGANGIIAIDRFGTVLPAIMEVMQILAMASQIKAGGTDVTMAQVGGTTKSFTATAQSDKDNGTKDAGTTIWQGGALALLAGTIKPDKNGNIPNDIDIKHKGAFNPPHVQGLLTIANKLVDYSFLGFASIVPDKCGWGGTIGQFVLGGIEQGVIGLINLPDGETATAAEEVGLQVVIRKLISTVVGVAEGAAVGYAEGLALDQVKDIIVNSNSAKQLAADAFTGERGGNYIAYAARAGGNLLGAASGAIPLANTLTTTLLGSAGQEEQQSFEQESFTARLFDISDTRSLLGHLSMDITPGFGANVSPIFNSVLGTYSSLPGNLFSLFSGHSFADSAEDSWTGNYNWGFPQWGVPNNLKANDDPASNAEDLGYYLSTVCPGGAADGQCGGSNGYTTRIKACFGSDLTETDGLWDVSPAQAPDTGNPVDIDPGNPNYISADCTNANNGGLTVCKKDTLDANGNIIHADDDTSPSCIWGRVILFSNDDPTLKAMACATMSTSCPDIGAPQTNDAPANTSTNGTTTGGTSQTQTSMAPASRNTSSSTIASATSRSLFSLPSDIKWVRNTTTALLPQTGAAL